MVRIRRAPAKEAPPLFLLPEPTPEGVVAIGGRPDAETLLSAYAQGIFPWPQRGAPLCWFCPDPRFVLVPKEISISRSLAKTLRRGRFGVRADTAFAEVMARCAAAKRRGQRGTWITRAMIAGFSELHARGLAHSIEAWRDGQLVGGLYGLALGGVFFGESMFAEEPDASKVCLATLAANLAHWDFPLLDCQQPTEHLASFGAFEMPRSEFLATLEPLLARPDRLGPWQLDIGPLAVVSRLGG